MKKYIYTIIIGVLIVVNLYKMDVFEPREMNVEGFTIQRPFLYKYGQKKVSVDKEGRITIYAGFWSSYKTRTVLLKFIKTPSLEVFKSDVKKDIININLDMCYIKNLANQSTDNGKVNYLRISSFPYIVEAVELNKKRADALIKQVCKNIETLGTEEN